MQMEKLIANCEAFVRAGSPQKAAKLISKLNLARLHRQYRLKFANLCRRTGLISSGLQILTPVLFPKELEKADATAAEQAEYAVLLQRAGSVEEALEILNAISPEEIPEVLIYRCYCLFNKWEYRKAIPPLDQYLSLESAGYSTLVAQVNLCSALVECGDFDNANQKLIALETLARSSQALRLQGNCLEMLAQVCIHQGQLHQAESYLNDAASLLVSAGTHDELFIMKWRAILTALREGRTEALATYRLQAVERAESEAVRETDFFWLMVDFDSQKFEHLYFGTPFERYREKITRRLFREPKAAVYQFGRADQRYLDLRDGALSDGQDLSLDSKILHLFRSLLTDFYRPRLIGNLFSDLFPKERFDIFSSPGRVRQLMYRARKWAKENNVPAEIVLINDRYRVDVNGDFAFRVPLGSPVASNRNHQIELLMQKFSQRDFTAAQAQSVLGVSRATCTRILQQAVETNRLGRFGASTNTVYTFSVQGQEDCA